MNKVKYMSGIVLLMALVLVSCSDKPSADNYSTFTARMMSDYLKEYPEYSYFTEIVNHAVPAEESSTSGKLMDQLSAYGHYTLFLPDNNAIMNYLNNERHITLEELLSDGALCDTIARTHLLSEIYLTSDMPTGVLPTQNMMQRNIEVMQDNDEQGHGIVIVNKKATIFFSQTHQNDTVTNGVVHRVDAVVTNQSSGVADLMEGDPYIKTYVEALKLTELNSLMDSVEDKQYKKKYDENKNSSWADEALPTGSREKENVSYPQRRLYGFTAFMVKDKTLEKYNSTLTNKFNAEGDVSQNILALSELASKYYTTTVPYTSTDYANPEHPLYKFMAYHILDRNVQGYNFLTVREDAGIDRDIVNPTDWYTTRLPYSMIKVQHLTVAGQSDDMGDWLGTGVKGDYYINRNFNKDNKAEGVHVQPSVEVQDNNAANGIYFYVDDILTYYDEGNKTKNDVFNTRIRMDFSTIFPEIMTNNIRMNGPNITGSNKGTNYRFPQGYLSGVKFNTDDTRLIYWYARSGYYSMNGDEMDAQDLFDITFDLPPVPFSGMWQIRLGFAPMNTSNDAANYRGQVQIYFDDKAQGLPLDFSKTLAEVYGISASDWGNIKYEELRQDDEKRQEDFKILKNKGYYRGPHSVFNSSNGEISGKYNTFSQMRNTARKVLCTVNIEAGKRHTLRIKNVSQGLTAKTKEAMLDYLELVPRSIYDITGDKTEDDL
ncbi:MAG: fasciclin domain-containing protein [Prevotella sp.]|nr:fasciclin domain-containing protein [Prevotella sp.]